MISPFVDHAAPRHEPHGARTSGAPVPSTGTFLSWPYAVNATHLPSGENAGWSAPSVPGISCTVTSPIERAYSMKFLPGFAPTHTMVRPSLDNASGQPTPCPRVAVNIGIEN